MFNVYVVYQYDIHNTYVFSIHKQCEYMRIHHDFGVRFGVRLLARVLWVAGVVGALQCRRRAAACDYETQHYSTNDFRIYARAVQAAAHRRDKVCGAGDTRATRAHQTRMNEHTALAQTGTAMRGTM